MNEKLIVSGRNIIDLFPHEKIWGLSIPIYLFIGGLAAGLLIFATLFYILQKDKQYPFTVKVATIIPFFIISLGLLLLIEDLRHKLYFWQLMLHFKIESPMSWGSWVLVIITLISIFWPLSFIDDIINFFENNNKPKLAKISKAIQKFTIKYKLITKILDFFKTKRKEISYVLFVLAVILGIYTGILLSSFNARPIWNNSIISILFLVSGASTAAALIMWLTNNTEERRLYSKIDIGLITVELVLIALFLLSMIWGTEIQQRAVKMFLDGAFTATFWGIFVTGGLILPLTLEIMEIRKIHIPVGVPAFLVLLGGLIFRIIMVFICRNCIMNINLHL